MGLAKDRRTRDRRRMARGACVVATATILLLVAWPDPGGPATEPSEEQTAAFHEELRRGAAPPRVPIGKRPDRGDSKEARVAHANPEASELDLAIELVSGPDDRAVRPGLIWAAESLGGRPLTEPGARTERRIQTISLPADADGIRVHVAGYRPAEATWAPATPPSRIQVSLEGDAAIIVTVSGERDLLRHCRIALRHDYEVSRKGRQARKTHWKRVAVNAPDPRSQTSWRFTAPSGLDLRVMLEGRGMAIEELDGEVIHLTSGEERVVSLDAGDPQIRYFVLDGLAEELRASRSISYRFVDPEGRTTGGFVQTDENGVFAIAAPPRTPFGLSVLVPPFRGANGAEPADPFVPLTLAPGERTRRPGLDRELEVARIAAPVIGLVLHLPDSTVERSRIALQHRRSAGLLPGEPATRFQVRAIAGRNTALLRRAEVEAWAPADRLEASARDPGARGSIDREALLAATGEDPAQLFLQDPLVTVVLHVTDMPEGRFSVRLHPVDGRSAVNETWDRELEAFVFRGVPPGRHAIRWWFHAEQDHVDDPEPLTVSAGSDLVVTRPFPVREPEVAVPGRVVNFSALPECESETWTLFASRDSRSHAVKVATDGSFPPITLDGADNVHLLGNGLKVPVRLSTASDETWLVRAVTDDLRSIAITVARTLGPDSHLTFHARGRGLVRVRERMRGQVHFWTTEQGPLTLTVFERAGHAPSGPNSGFVPQHQLRPRGRLTIPDHETSLDARLPGRTVRIDHDRPEEFVEVNLLVSGDPITFPERIPSAGASLWIPDQVTELEIRSHTTNVWRRVAWNRTSKLHLNLEPPR